MRGYLITSYLVLSPQRELSGAIELKSHASSRIQPFVARKWGTAEGKRSRFQFGVQKVNALLIAVFLDLQITTGSLSHCGWLISSVTKFTNESIIMTGTIQMFLMLFNAIRSSNTWLEDSWLQTNCAQFWPTCPVH